MESRPRIHYKAKYELMRNIAITSTIMLVFMTVFAFKTAKAFLDMQANFISPDRVSAEIQEGR